MFCGPLESCRPLYSVYSLPGRFTEKAVVQAKRVISDEYLFVGTTERMDDSLRILGRLLPTFFEVDLTDLYASSVWVGIRKLIQPPPRPLSQTLVNAALLQWDMEVYEHATALLDEQAAGCGISG
mmetsp:Transcript_1566/g.3339  ORF Transcript_1566/g.3339 Transcript_1566/m.3339 type:complete len:125 (+) Transcript_1566:586-960(+)